MLTALALVGLAAACLALSLVSGVVLRVNDLIDALHEDIPRLNKNVRLLKQQQDDDRQFVLDAVAILARPAAVPVRVPVPRAERDVVIH